MRFLLSGPSFALHLSLSLFHSPLIVRIHWAIVIFAVFGTILLTWHFRTRNMDFMTPQGIILPPEDDGSNLTAGASEPQPNVETNPATTEILGNPENPEAEDIPHITDADLGDLEISPGLSTYREFGQTNIPSRLFELSSTLRARGQSQRALLALERVIDSSDADSEQLVEASKGIAALTPTLPQWNIDTKSEITLILDINSARPASDSLKKAALEVATLIRKSSGDQLDIIPKLTDNDASEAPENSPVALKILTTGEKPASSTLTTVRVSEENSQAVNNLSLAIFRLIRNHLADQDYSRPSPIPATGQELLTTHITRLMWRDFANSLYQLEKISNETPLNDN